MCPNGPGVRIDSLAYSGAVISPHYDSLVAKLITHGADRQEAIDRMHRALDMFVIEGIKTTIPLHKKILAHPDFLSGNISTAFLDGIMPEKPKSRRVTSKQQVDA